MNTYSIPLTQEDMGMSYDELSDIGRLRKEHAYLCELRICASHVATKVSKVSLTDAANWVNISTGTVILCEITVETGVIVR